MTNLAPEWVRTSDPVIRSPARYRWTTANFIMENYCMKSRVQHRNCTVSLNGSARNLCIGFGWLVCWSLTSLCHSNVTKPCNASPIN